MPKGRRDQTILIYLGLKHFKIESNVILIVHTTTVWNVSGLRGQVSNITSNLSPLTLSPIVLLNVFGKYVSAFRFRSQLPTQCHLQITLSTEQMSLTTTQFPPNM